MYLSESALAKSYLLVSDKGSGGEHLMYRIANGVSHVTKYSNLREALEQFQEYSSVDLSEKYEQQIMAECHAADKAILEAKKERRLYKEIITKMKDVSEAYSKTPADKTDLRLSLTEAYGELEKAKNVYEAKMKDEGKKVSETDHDDEEEDDTNEAAGAKKKRMMKDLING